MDAQQYDELKQEIGNIGGFAADNGYSLSQVVQRLDRIIELLESRTGSG